MPKKLSEILKMFPIVTEPVPYGNGHINDTYTTAGEHRYILQRINTNVFKDPVGLMTNIYSVTQFMKKKIEEYGGDPTRETLTVIPTIDGKLLYIDEEDGSAYRVYDFIENTISVELAESPEQLFNAGKAFGKFQRLLSDFPAKQLVETIPRFHDTPNRVNNLKNAIEENAIGRVASCQNEINFALEYSKYSSMILDGIADKTVPLRVTHNDTKINNVLLDKESLEGVCVIDLDTVMPGSMLYDYGDALRFGAATAEEDEPDLSKMWFNLEFFEAFTRGFLSETKSTFTEKEIELLPYSVLILTYECGTRFLEDYIRGDVYFKTKKPIHNLLRARTQYKLVRDIEEKIPEMIKIVDKILKEE